SESKNSAARASRAACTACPAVRADAVSRFWPGGAQGVCREPALSIMKVAGWPLAGEHPGHARLKLRVQRVSGAAADGNPERVLGQHAVPVAEDDPPPERHLPHRFPGGWRG